MCDTFTGRVSVVQDRSFDLRRFSRDFSSHSALGWGTSIVYAGRCRRLRRRRGRRKTIHSRGEIKSGKHTAHGAEIKFWRFMVHAICAGKGKSAISELWGRRSALLARPVGDRKTLTIASVVDWYGHLSEEAERTFCQICCGKHHCSIKSCPTDC